MSPPPNDDREPPQKASSGSAPLPPAGVGHTIVTHKQRDTRGGLVTKESVTYTNRLDVDRYQKKRLTPSKRLAIASHRPSPGMLRALEPEEPSRPWDWWAWCRWCNWTLLGGKWCPFLLIGLLLCLLYALWRRAQLAEKQKELSQTSLHQKMALFPKDPMEYNFRQRLWHQMYHQRRHNFLAVGLLSLGVIGMIAIMIWHRARRVVIQKRKTIGFWVFTASAAVLAISWPIYVVYMRSPVQEAIHQVRRHPFLRFSLLLTLIIILAILLYSYFKYEKRKHKRHHHHHLSLAGVAGAPAAAGAGAGAAAGTAAGTAVTAIPHKQAKKEEVMRMLPPAVRASDKNKKIKRAQPKKNEPVALRAGLPGGNESKKHGGENPPVLVALPPRGRKR